MDDKDADTANSSDDDSPEETQPSKKGGRRRINIEFIEDKSRRHITFSKRKAGIMKKAYELSTLTGTQILLLVASETGHVYTFATPKLQPLITKQEGKALIQECLNAPEAGGAADDSNGYEDDSPPSPSHGAGSQAAYEEDKKDFRFASDMQAYRPSTDTKTEMPPARGVPPPHHPPPTGDYPASAISRYDTHYAMPHGVPPTPQQYAAYQPHPHHQQHHQQQLQQHQLQQQHQQQQQQQQYWTRSSQPQ